MWQYRDYWNGSEYRRQLEGSTIQITLKPTNDQHYRACQLLHFYCSTFNRDSPVVIGRGCYNIWNPRGYRSAGTRELYSLEVYSSEFTRDTFATTFGRTAEQVQHVPGEVIVYGQGEMAVYLDDQSQTAVPLSLYCSTDACMRDYPSGLSTENLIDKSQGFNMLHPIPGLIVTLSIWVKLQEDMAPHTNNPAAQTWLYQMRIPQQILLEDIHDFRFLCYSRARHYASRGTSQVDPNEPHLASARRNVESYLRSFSGNDVQTEAERNTATDHFIEIGLYPRGTVWGPQYGLYGQSGW